MTGMSGKSAARDAILQAFADIILESGYAKVRVLDIIEHAGVARSTFYEHFQNREDVLRDSVRGPFEVLAQLAAPSCDLTRVALTLEHFMENRALAKSMMGHPGTDALIDLLSELIETRLDSSIPAMIVRAVAGAKMAVISSWLDGKDPYNANDVAQTLRGMSLALLRTASKSSVPCPT